PHVLGIVLAGGEGKRLYPLTADRAKPAGSLRGAPPAGGFFVLELVHAPNPPKCLVNQNKTPFLCWPNTPNMACCLGWRADTSPRCRRSSGSARAGTPALRTRSISR